MHAQQRLTLRNPMDCSPPGSSVHGILQARMLEWVAISFSRGSSRPGNQTQSLHWQAGSLPLAPPGKSVKVTSLQTMSSDRLLEKNFKMGGSWRTQFPAVISNLMNTVYSFFFSLVF